MSIPLHWIVERLNTDNINAKFADFSQSSQMDVAMKLFF